MNHESEYPLNICEFNLNWELYFKFLDFVENVAEKFMLNTIFSFIHIF